MDLRSAELAELLAHGPGNRLHAWARAVLLRSLETGVSYGCRYGALSGKGRQAQQSLRLACRTLKPPDRDLYARVMLLMGWFVIRRDTGLEVTPQDVLRVLADECSKDELEGAVAQVLESGAKAVSTFPLDGLLLEERLPGRGFIVTIPESERRPGLKVPSTIEIDRVEVALRSFVPYSWEANIRAMVPWWLDTMSGDAAKAGVKSMLRKVNPQKNDWPSRYRLQGLMDWMMASPAHPQAEEVLQLGLHGNSGDLRRTAAKLALAMKNLDALDALSHHDSDTSVRRLAAKLLDQAGNERQGGYGLPIRIPSPPNRRGGLGRGGIGGPRTKTLPHPGG